VKPQNSGKGYLFIHVTFTNAFMNYYTGNSRLPTSVEHIKNAMAQALTDPFKGNHNGVQMFENIVVENIQ
jgi:hypothetical protein